MAHPHRRPEAPTYLSCGWLARTLAVLQAPSFHDPAYAYRQSPSSRDLLWPHCGDSAFLTPGLRAATLIVRSINIVPSQAVVCFKPMPVLRQTDDQSLTEMVPHS